jgi:hypothetical protein
VALRVSQKTSPWCVGRSAIMEGPTSTTHGTDELGLCSHSHAWHTSSITLGVFNLTFSKTTIFFKNHCKFLVFRRREDFYFLLDISIQKTILKKLLVFGSLLIFENLSARILESLRILSRASARATAAALQRNHEHRRWLSESEMRCRRLCDSEKPAGHRIA